MTDVILGMEDAFKHMKILRCRILWLTSRIQHDVDEQAALEWALNTIDEWVELPEPPADYGDDRQFGESAN